MCSFGDRLVDRHDASTAGLKLVLEAFAQRAGRGPYIPAAPAEQLVAQVPQEQGQDVRRVLHHLDIPLAEQDASVRSVSDLVGQCG